MQLQATCEVSPIKYTLHASKRMQQRAISDVQIRLIEFFGDYKYQKGGYYCAYLPDKIINDLRKSLNKIKNVRAIYSDENTLITVMHGTRKCHFDKKAIK